MKPALLYNIEPDPKEELLNYYFVIINRDKREMQKITTRLQQKLAPIIETKERNGQSRGLHYRILKLDSNKKVEDWEWREMYQSKNVRKDERVYSRASDGWDGLENYVISLITKGNI